MTAMTRRTFLGGLAALGATTVSLGQSRFTLAAIDPKLGGSEADFSAAFGAGVDEDSLVRFGDGSGGHAIYRVDFGGIDAAIMVEDDFTSMSGGGILDYQDQLGHSMFLPDSAQLIDALAGGNMPPGGSKFALTTYATGDSNQPALILVCDEVMPGEVNGSLSHILTRTNIVQNGNLVLDPRDYGTPGTWPTCYAGVDAWQAEYGYASPGQNNNAVANPPTPGSFMLGSTQIEIRLQEPSASTVEGATWIGNMLPQDAALEGAWLLPATASGPVGLRVSRWTSSADNVAFQALMYIHGDEQTGTTDRVILTARPLETGSI